MFDIILICSKYILNCPWLCLASGENTKNIDISVYIMAANIGCTYVKNTCIDNTYTMGTLIGWADVGSACIKCIYVKETFARAVELKALAELEIILIDIKVYNYCFLSFIELIFVLTKRMSCYNK